MPTAVLRAITDAGVDWYLVYACSCFVPDPCSSLSWASCLLVAGPVDRAGTEQYWIDRHSDAVARGSIQEHAGTKCANQREFKKPVVNFSISACRCRVDTGVTNIPPFQVLAPGPACVSERELNATAGASRIRYSCRPNQPPPCCVSMG